MIEKLFPSIFAKGVVSFLGHIGFFVCLIKDFLKIAHPLCKLYEKDAKFVFNDVCLTIFKCLKQKLISSPIIVCLDWSYTFKIICDTSGLADGVVL